MVISHDDIFNPVKGKEQQLIELFVRLYGEQNREKITDRINNTEFIFIDMYPKQSIMEFYSQKRNEIREAFYKEVEILPLLAGVDSFELIQESLANREYEDTWLQSFIERMGLEGDAKDVLQQEDNYNRVINKLKQCIEVWDGKYSDTYNELLEEMIKYAKPFDKMAKKSDQIIYQYIDDLKMYIRSNLNIPNLADEDLDYLIEALEDIIQIGKERLSDEFIVGNQLKGRFIKAFKLMGYDYGYNYEQYINDLNLLDTMFNPKLIEYITQQKQEMRIKRIYNNSMFMDAVKRIEQLDIKGGNYGIVKSIYGFATGSQKNLAAFCTSYVNSKNEIRNICVLPLGINLSTETFIHELGHAVTSDIRYVDDITLVYKTGYDVLMYEFCNKNFDVETFVKEESWKSINIESSNKQDEFDNNRRNELISEVYHDFIMTAAAIKAKNQGLIIGLKDEIRTTQYSIAFPMIQDFVYKNVGLIKASQIDEDPMMFGKHIGMDNFQKLSKAIHNCVKYQTIYNNELNAEFLERYSEVKDMTMFDIAHLEVDWSPRMRKFLDTYLDAEEVFYNYYQSQQVSQ